MQGNHVPNPDYKEGSSYSILMKPEQSQESHHPGFIQFINNVLEFEFIEVYHR